MVAARKIQPNEETRPVAEQVPANNEEYGWNPSKAEIALGELCDTMLKRFFETRDDRWLAAAKRAHLQCGRFAAMRGRSID